MSPSSRGRGLKFDNVFLVIDLTGSPSSRGRGLKCGLPKGWEDASASRPLHEGVD